MARLTELFPKLEDLSADGFARTRRRQAALNLMLQNKAARNAAGSSLAKAPKPKKPKRLRLQAPPKFDERPSDDWMKKRPRMVSGPKSIYRSARANGKPSIPSAPGTSQARSPETVRAHVASGSQSAVVKLASFASGSARVGALMSYQSHAGELALEAADGSRIEGLQNIQALARQWAEEAPEREPSKDMLMFGLTLPATATDEEIRERLREGLAGHKYAFRIERGDARAEVDVVMTAASSQKSQSGKAHRLYDNQKSLNALEGRLLAEFAGYAIGFDEKGFAHGVEGASRYLARLTKGGSRAAETNTGRILQGHEANLDQAKTWKRDMRSREQRDTAHIILSAKPGTDRKAFLDAARATLEREFGGHRYVFALHDNRAHLHVHSVVQMRSQAGERLHPRIQDFTRWRQTLAEEARQRMIPMEAASRFEQANPPGFKLRDVRRVERGEASDKTRRRVEAVRTSAIHVPTRPEGRERAKAAANAWRQFTPLAEPPIAAGMTRFYRAERTDGAGASAPLFARDRATADKLAKRTLGAVSFVDVPVALLSEVKAARSGGGRYVVVPPELAVDRQVLCGAGTVLRLSSLRHRTAAAVDRSKTIMLHTEHLHDKDSNKPIAIGKPKMPSVETIEASRPEVTATLNEFIAVLPEEKKERARKLAEQIEANLDRATKLQTKQDAAPGRIEGDREVPPKPKAFDNFAAYVSDQRGDSIRYANRRTDGSAGALKFTDHAHKVVVNDWKDREATLAAMQLSVEKWGELTVTGPDRYKAMVVQLAAEHGMKLRNPELQEALAKERQRSADRAEKQAGFTSGEQLQPAQAANEANKQTSTAKHTLTIDNEDAANTLMFVQDYKEPEAVRMLDLMRVAQAASGAERERVEYAAVLARRQAIDAMSHQTQIQFQMHSGDLFRETKLMSAERLAELDERAKQEIEANKPQKSSLEAQDLAARILALKAGISEDQRSDSFDSARFKDVELKKLEKEYAALPFDQERPDTVQNSHTLSIVSTRAKNAEDALRRFPEGAADRLFDRLIAAQNSPAAEREKANYAAVEASLQTTSGLKGESSSHFDFHAGILIQDALSLSYRDYSNIREKIRKDADEKYLQKDSPGAPELAAQIVKLRQQIYYADASDSFVTKARLSDELADATKAYEALPFQAPTPTETADRSGAPIGKPEMTQAGRDVGLARIRDKVDAEAKRETRDATASKALHEAPTDPGFRSEAEAATARAADRTIETNPSHSIPNNLANSPELKRLEEQQARIHRDQAVADRTAAAHEQVKAEIQTQRHKPGGQRR